MLKKILTTVCLLLLVSCRVVTLPQETQAKIENRIPFYTQLNMWTEKGLVFSTNYKRGALIPLNTKVFISNVSSDTIVFSFGSADLKLINVEKHSRMNIEKLLNRTFKPQPKDLAPFSPLEKTAIENGDVTPGMSKQAVVLARGYPPANHTPSLELNAWRYWQHRFNTINVVFKHNKVVKIIN